MFATITRIIIIIIYLCLAILVCLDSLWINFFNTTGRQMATGYLLTPNDLQL